MNKQQLQQEIAELQKQLEEKQKALSAMPDKWEPEGGEWFVYGGSACKTIDMHDDLVSFGVAYKSKEQAEKASKAMRAHNRLLAYVTEFAPDYKSDWDDKYQLKSEVIFDSERGGWITEDSVGCYSPSVVYMPDYVAEELASKLNSGEVEL